MKFTQYSLVLLTCILIFFLISAHSEKKSEEVSRFHISCTSGSICYVYDSVTGEVKPLNYARIGKANNIKELLKDKSD